MLRQRPLLPVLGVLSLLAVTALPRAGEAAAPVVLESSALRLSVTDQPYRFELLHKASKLVLLAHHTTELTIAGKAIAASHATNLRRKGNSLSADLVLVDSAQKARVSFSFKTPQVLRVRIEAGDAKAERIAQSFEDRKEHVYGIWEYPFGGKLDNRGTKADLLGVGKTEGVWFSSARAPFYLTSNKYGIYAESTALGHYSVAIDGKTGFWFAEPSLTYDVIYGDDPYQILARYTAIAGAPFMPPLWAFGSDWWSDDFHNALHGTKNAQENILDLASKLEQHKIPAGSICFDRPIGSGEMGWGNADFDKSFPDPAKLITDLRAKGLEVVVWAANRAWNTLYTEGKAKGYLFDVDSKLGPATDLRNPAAYAWMKQHLDGYVKLGVKGYKIDRGEQGEQPDAVQNTNVTLFQRLAYEGMTAKHGSEVFSFARNVYDTGRKYTAVWNGDTPLTFTGLRYSVVSGLRSGAIVMPMWGSDTGGYVPAPDGPSEELFIRWFQFSAFSPLLEVVVGGTHTPWYDYTPKMIEVTRAQAALHHDLIPYTRSLMFEATRSGAPIMRPLAFSYPNDPAAVTLGDQFLYGPDLLVAPVVEQGQTSRSVYLPAGRWVDHHDRRTVAAGGRAVTAAAPLERIPVYAREGAIIPRGDIFKGNNTWTKDWSPKLRIEVFPSEAVPGKFGYYTGKASRPITAVTRKGRTTIAFPDLGTPGTVEVFVTAIGRVRRNGKTLVAGSDYTFDAAAARLAVPFQGATKLEIDGVVSLFGVP
jgi:alpha-D-xyloside xylohydrolase